MCCWELGGKKKKKKKKRVLALSNEFPGSDCDAVRSPAPAGLALACNVLRGFCCRFGSLVHDITRFYHQFHKDSVGIDGIFLHDPTALLMLLRPQASE